jgi:branched-chain amino acid transport system ATP-binding protein
MLLEVRGLTKRFGGLIANENISFSLEEGEITALIGPNGAGKTTLFNCVSGYYQTYEGDIFLREQSLKGKMPHRILRTGLARTFQLVRNFEGMTILENIMTAGHSRSGQGFINTMLALPSVSKSETTLRKNALEIMDFLELTTVGEKYPNEISYGQKRLVEVAKVLATGANLLLLDEPAAGLNDQETLTLMKTLKKIQEMGKTILIVEHNMKFVMGLAQKIVVLDFGKKIAEGTPDDIKSNEKVISAYLGRDFVLA